MKAVRHFPLHCLRCGREINSVSHPQHEAQPGDLTVCMYCGVLLEYGPELASFKPVDESTLHPGTAQMVQQMREGLARLHAMPSYRKKYGLPD